MEEEIREAVAYLRERMKETPEIGMITGTGLTPLTEDIEVHFRLDHQVIPRFPVSTVEGHRGTLVVGRLSGKLIIALEGRFHLYEGYTAGEITFPVRVMAMLGVKYLLISSAVGGLNPQFETGDLMVVTDHINFTGTNPLVGPNLDALGPRFPDMTRVYDAGLVALVKDQALKMGLPLREGVYIGVLGPSLETPAETRFLRSMGGDAVGMSTVSEAIVGVHSGLRVLAIVVITNVNLPDCMEETTGEDVVAEAYKAAPRLSALWEKVIEALPG